MKPFNLDEAKAGKPVVTRDGRDVIIYDFDYSANTCGAICGVAINEDRIKSLYTWSDKGLYISSVNSPYDIFMKTEKKEGWINIYRNQIIKLAAVHDTEEQALKNAGTNCVATIKIEWEE